MTQHTYKRQNVVSSVVSMREFAAAIFPSRVRETARFVTILTAYLDASREGGERVYCLAGFISNAERWDSFDREWQAILDEYEIADFHMTDFEARQGEFARWERNDGRSIPLLTSLMSVIDRNTIASVAYGVSQEMYDAYVPQTVKDIVASPYFFLFLRYVVNTQNLLNSAVQLNAGVPPDWRMLYMLARGDAGAGQVLEVWMSNAPGARFGRKDTRTLNVIIPKDNSEYLAFQAADILAFEGRKQIALQLGIHNREPRKSYKALSDIYRKPNSWKFFEEPAQIRLVADAIERAVLGKNSGTLLTLE